MNSKPKLIGLVKLFDINNFNENEIIQIIPQEKKNKFEKNKFTILQIGA